MAEDVELLAETRRIADLLGGRLTAIDNRHIEHSDEAVVSFPSEFLAARFRRCLCVVVL